MFNCRRPGENTNFQDVRLFRANEEKREVQDEIFQSLSLAQKLSAKRLTLITTRRKRDRVVPILLTPDMEDSDFFVAKVSKLLIKAEKVKHY